MKRIQFILSGLLIFIHSAYCLNIDAGTYYYDNSKTGWQTVQFIYGTDNPSSYTVVDLSDKGNNIWELTIPVKVNDTYRYCFGYTDLPVGTFTDKSFSEMKDYISLTLGLLRTATKDAPIPANGTFVPDNAENWAQGSWRVEAIPTKTIPVFYMNTENGEDIVSQEDYLNATMYIDAEGISGYNSFGTFESPVVTQTRGRGNYTWSSFDKKPYRLKMDKKAELLNMTEDKSYNLIAHADDPTFLRNTVGFELSSLLGLSFTPAHEPVELVLNGDYKGLYFLTEHIKISENRVNITEQKDMETDPELITGGWLIEIDNYYDDNQVSTTRVPRFTIKSPEVLSPEQDNYIRSFLQATEDAIYQQDKNSTDWEKYIDLKTFVDFYIIQEITGNTESFNGSCYFTKDKGAGAKIYFGPVWDFGNAFRHGHQFIYQDIIFSSYWLPEIVKYPRFQEEVSRRWTEIRYTLLPELFPAIDVFADKIKTAVVQDYNRWPMYGSSNYTWDKSTAVDYITDRIAWLDTKWYNQSSVNDERENILQVYPNPAVNTIYIKCEEGVKAINLYSITGQHLKVFDAMERKIDLGVIKGTYILQVVTGKNTYSEKIIVQ